MKLREKPAAIAILAVYPPPWGGVANHVVRLSRLLEARALSHTIYNAVSDSIGTEQRVVPVAHGRAAWLVRYALTARERLIYIFSDRLSVWLVGAAMARSGKNVIVRLRNHALPTYLADPRTRGLAKLALSNVTHVIAVSRALAHAAREAGVPEERVLHQPGFLPPQSDSGETLSIAQQSFVDAHQPIIAANGKVAFHGGADLYGLDQLVEVVVALRPSFPRIGLMVSFWDHLRSDETHLAKLMRRAREAGVQEHILFHTESRPFLPVLERADLFIRPTCTDGDANSVREALYLGVPTLASDVVERPPGATLVRTRDLKDLVEKAKAALANSSARRPDPSVVDEEGVERYLSLLTRLSATREG